MDLPPPAIRGDGPRVALPARLAANAAVHSAWRASGLTKVALGEKIGRSETEIRRLLDPDYGTKLDQLGEAADALGRRLFIAFTTTPRAEMPICGEIRRMTESVNCLAWIGGFAAEGNRASSSTQACRSASTARPMISASSRSAGTRGFVRGGAPIEDCQLVMVWREVFSRFRTFQSDATAPMFDT
jgi:hypothetical protein